MQNNLYCKYCPEPAILCFDDKGKSYYVCSADHYHLHYQRQFKTAIKPLDNPRRETHIMERTEDVPA